MKNIQIIVLVFFILLSASTLVSTNVTCQTATIWTDKVDYHPGGTVTIYGTGFMHNANVDLNVTKQLDGSISSLNVMSDANGNFTATYKIDTFGAPLYTVTATDKTNVVTTTFKDTLSISSFNSNTASSGTTVTVSSLACQVGDLIIVLSKTHGGGSPVTVSSIASTPVQTFTDRKTVSGGSNHAWINERYVVATAAVTSVTVTFSGTLSSSEVGDVIVFSISGANPITPFDTHTGLPYSFISTGTGAPSVSSVATSNANDMIIGLEGSRSTTTETAGSISSPSTSLTLTKFQVAGSDGGAAAERGIVSGILSSATVNFGTSLANDWVMIVDAVQSAVTETVTITPANSFSSSASVTVSGAAVTTIPMDGAPHTFYASASSTITFTVPGDGTTSRYRFNVAAAASTTWTYTTGSSGATDTKTSTVYYQNRQTLSYSIVYGGSPTAPTATGTAVGVAYAPSLTTSAANYWFDYSSTTIAISTPTGTNEKWAPNPASISATQTNTQIVSLYNQYKQTLSYIVINGGSPTAPTATGTSLGSASSPSLTISATDYWFDASGSIAINTPTASNERWVPGTATISATATHTQVVSMYNEFSQTLNYAVVGGGSPSAPTATGAALGSAYVPSLTTSATVYWFDATGSIAISTPTATNEQWAPNPASISASSAHTQAVSMQNQYKVTFTQNGITSDAGSNTILTINGVTTYTRLTLPSAVYIDSGTTFSWSSSVAGFTGEKFVPNGALTGLTSPISAAGTSTAAYKTQYQVNFAVSGSGSITSPSAGSGFYDSGSLSIVALANIGQSFSQWSSDTGSITFTSPTSASTSATIAGTGTITATFATNQVTLTLSPGVGGSIGANPSSGWHYNDVVTLTANPSPGYSFTIWGGSLSGSTNPTTITMTSDKTVSASFTANSYPLTVNIVGSGSVAKTPNQANYAFGSTVSLQANTNPGYTFSGWTGDYVGATNPYVLTIDTTPSITATFTQNSYTIAASVSGGHGTINPSGSVGVTYDGSQVFTVAADPGYHIANVLIDGVAASAPYTVSHVVDNSRTIVASFAIDTFAITVTQTANGLITGPSSVNWGTDAVYSIAPAVGYIIVDVVVDGHTQGAVTSATINNVKETGHSITASYALTIHSTILTISVDPKIANKYDSPHATVSGYLKSEATGLNLQPVTVSYNDGRNGWIECGHPTTDANGYYTVDFPVTPDFANGFVAFEAKFAGDTGNGYAPATPVHTGAIGEESGNLNVLPEYIFGGLAALGACFVGFVVFKKRNSLPQLRLK